MRSMFFILIIFTLASNAVHSASGLQNPIEKIPLAGDWNFHTDPNDKGLKSNYFQYDFQDKDWDKILVPGAWERDVGGRYINYKGIAWYRKHVNIPEAWRGNRLKLTLGRVDSQHIAYFNGVEIGKQSGPNLTVYYLDPKLVRYGEKNIIAVRVKNTAKACPVSGIRLGDISINTSVLEICDIEIDGKVTGNNSLSSPDSKISIGCEINAGGISRKLTVDYEMIDFSCRSLGKGKMDVAVGAGENKKILLDVPATEVTRLYRYGSDPIRIRVAVSDGNRKISSRQRDFNITQVYRQLPVLSPKYVDLGEPFGQVKLIDEIHCYEPDDPHPRWEGGRGLNDSLSGNRDRIKWNWETYRELRNNYSRVENVLGEPCRIYDGEMEGWFAYKLGRDKLKEGGAYVIEVEYPEDLPRTFHMVNTGAADHMGFHTGSTLGNFWPHVFLNERVPYPLEKKYKKWYSFFFLHKYVWNGNDRFARDGRGRDGFWFLFYWDGKNIAPFSNGVAVRTIKLFEIEDPKSLFVEPNWPPKELPRRDIVSTSQIFGAIVPHADGKENAGNVWKEEAMRLRVLGVTSVAYSFSGEAVVSWESSLYPRSVWPAQAHKFYEFALNATREYGINLIPRIAYYGSPRLPKEAKAVTSTGRLYGGNQTKAHERANSANILHPATFEEIQTVISELIGKYHQDYQNLKGIMLRPLFACTPISFDAYSIERYRKEMASKVPNGSVDGMRKWILTYEEEKYYTWWREARRKVFLKIVAELKSYSPRLSLYWFNWTADASLPWNYLNKERVLANFHLDENIPFQASQLGRPKDYSKISLVDLIRARVPKKQREYAETGALWNCFSGCQADLFKHDKGIYYLCPVYGRYTVENKEYFDFFRTAEGLAINIEHHLNEYPSMGTIPNFRPFNNTEHGGGPYTLLEEVYSMAYGDPKVIVLSTTVRLNRGFPFYTRRFAKAFLALPSVPSTVISDCVVNNSDKKIVLRSYPTAYGEYLAAINTGFQGKQITISIPTEKPVKSVRNLVAGDLLEFHQGNGHVTFHLSMGPVELQSFQLEPGTKQEPENSVKK